jgi:hypothetical protein
LVLENVVEGGFSWRKRGQTVVFCVEQNSGNQVTSGYLTAMQAPALVSALSVDGRGGRECRVQGAGIVLPPRDRLSGGVFAISSKPKACAGDSNLLKTPYFVRYK